MSNETEWVRLFHGMKSGNMYYYCRASSLQLLIIVNGKSDAGGARHQVNTTRNKYKISRYLEKLRKSAGTKKHFPASFNSYQTLYHFRIKVRFSTYTIVHQSSTLSFT